MHELDLVNYAFIFHKIEKSLSGNGIRKNVLYFHASFPSSVCFFDVQFLYGISCFLSDQETTDRNIS